MLALLMIIGLLLVATALLSTLGAGILAVLPLGLLLLVVGWRAAAFVAGRSPGAGVREVHKAELLGPGGPDDPDAQAGDGGGGRETQGAPQRLGAN